MPSQLPWFDRTFSDDDPARRSDEILERLRGTPARVEERVCDLAEDLLTVRVNGRWSIQDNVGHLGDLEPLWLDRTQDILAGRSPMRAADVTNEATWRAEHNTKRWIDLCARFRESRARWIDLLDTLASEDFTRTSIHPRLGRPMRLVELCVFVAEHDDFHLARIGECMRAATDPSERE